MFFSFFTKKRFTKSFGCDIITAFFKYAVVTQLVECHLAKVDVASSNLVYRSKMAPWPRGKARVCKTLIPGPIPGGASRKNPKFIAWCFFCSKVYGRKICGKILHAAQKHGIIKQKAVRVWKYCLKTDM